MVPESPRWFQVEKGKLIHIEQFLTIGTANTLLHNLTHNISWQQESITMFGRSILQPRLQAWFGDKSYQYSGLKLEPHPMPPALEKLKQQCEHICQQPFNSVLLNLYRDGHDYMGWHQDNEKELGEHPTIASISLGASRKFSLKQKYGDKKIDFELTHGSLLVMAGELQHHWRHALPKSRKVSQPRINLTFRNII
ncbi:alpha-ketoglutarate-dependent dioxygenase AlkB family protein [Vibrio fluminensis]|uniref:alpha-ketoglutarate-dependent dioxygenase AlkB family protein n=1 Tax=Vibrio fluminensis TaxID=2783614 RepID=UPI00188955E1|nr:alpha-ketoglutarate-dependent dioxygenase AlkB [Vibrio fluminensis]